MRGVITGRDVLSHLPLIWREFGVLCLLRCLAVLLSRRGTTFLDVAMVAFASRKPSR